MSDDRPDEGAPRDPRPSGRIRIVGATPATGEHPTVSPESPADPGPTDDPNRFGAVPIISADEPPPVDPTPPRGTPSAADEPPVRAVPDPEPEPEARPEPSVRGVPDLDDLDLPPTAAVPVVEPEPEPEPTPPPAPTATAADDDDLDDIRVWAAPDDDEPEIEAGRSARDDPYADLASDDDDALDAILGAPEDDAPLWGDGTTEAAAPAAAVPDWDEPAGSGPAESDLPHWSEPAATAEQDDAWAGVSGGPRWRGQGEESGEPEDFSDLLDETRVEPVGEDDVIFDDLDAEPGIPSAAGPPQRRNPYPDAPEDEEFYGGGGDGGGGGRDMQQAVVVGVGLVALLLVCALIGPAALVALATAIVVLATGELFTATRRGGYHPAVPVGLVGSGGMVLAAYWRGEGAIPLMVFLVVVTTLCWWLFDAGPGDHALPNVGITVFGVMYVGGLGSFAALLLKFPDGVGMLIGAVLVAVAADVGGLFVGQRMGRSPLTAASPNKTLEGFFGGIVVAVVASTLILGVVPGVFPWEFMDALILGVVGGVMTPLGDLCASRLKRDLGVKDMGNLLPGHGGLLDRFDGLLFVLPATYYVVRLLEVYANVP